MNNSVEVSYVLAMHRKDHGLTQAELAKKVGVSNKTVSKWETGSVLPDIYSLISLANVYSLTLDELLQGSSYSSMVKREQNKESKKKFLYRRRKKSLIILVSIFLLMGVYACNLLRGPSNLSIFIVDIICTLILVGVLCYMLVIFIREKE